MEQLQLWLDELFGSEITTFPPISAMEQKRSGKNTLPDM
jgi:hypothetical protein